MQCAETTHLPATQKDRTYSGPERIAGYRIRRVIGHGGMGTVYEAYDEKMKRRVALKVMQHRLAPSPKAHERFQREAWIAGRLDHPNLVKVFDRGVWKDYEYYAMEFVKGGSLHDVILSMKGHGRDSRWDLDYSGREYIAWCLSKIIDAARGLEHAHRNGIVHRDIKPMNILLTEDPCVVKIADFGIALDESAVRMTTEGHTVGTVAYMAPEQIKGRTDRVDPRSDIYSLGVTLFEMITLKLPFTGASQQLYLNSVLTERAHRPSRLNDHVSSDLDVVLGKALEKESAHRYATAEEFAADLQRVLEFRPIKARPQSVLSRLTKWVCRKPIHAALYAFLIVGVPMVAGLTVRSLNQQRLLGQVEIDSRLEEARRLYRGNRSAEALEPLADILARDPEQIGALQIRSLAYLDLAVRNRGTDRHDEYAGLALGDADRAANLLPNAAWPHTVKAHIKMVMGRIDDAERDRRRAAERRSEPPSLEEMQFDGLLAMNQGEYEKANEIFSHVIDRNPGIVEAQINRSRARLRMGDLSGAIDDAKVVAGLMPSDPWSRHVLGTLLNMAGRADEAAPHHKRAIEMRPDIADFHVGLADNLLARGRSLVGGESVEEARTAFEAAEAEARRALQIDPDLSWAHVNLGASLMERYRIMEEPDPALIDEASSAYGRVIAMWRTSESNLEEEAYLAALVNQCDVLIQTGELQRALEICRAAVDSDPLTAVNHYNLAGVYALMGRVDEALDSLERDVELGDADWGYLESDRWFESTREHPRYGQILERMKALQ